MGTKRKSKGDKNRSGAPDNRKLVVTNRKARHLYEILETVEAGMVLKGTEVKSMREGNISLDEAYGRIYEDAAYLVGAHIDQYTHASVGNHEPTRRRKLLMHKREVRKLKQKAMLKGLTLVPLEIYFNERGLAKISLGVGRGKKLHDKRQNLKERDARREMRKLD